MEICHTRDGNMSADVVPLCCACLCLTGNITRSSIIGMPKHTSGRPLHKFSPSQGPALTNIPRVRSDLTWDYICEAMHEVKLPVALDFIVWFLPRTSFAWSLVVISHVPLHADGDHVPDYYAGFSFKSTMTKCHVIEKRGMEISFYYAWTCSWPSEDAMQVRRVGETHPSIGGWTAISFDFVYTIFGSNQYPAAYKKNHVRIHEEHAQPKGKGI
ncbi:hypothetical protein DEU56DRAFT_182093 [Suillus clintonianus]|uniref:uncharacterized protein n=1 Tax=Suillus clintonianus TaxID=1904413 RepID=UPI001B861684|nr:uncharacterized protein DEU56DRAFT_182093 [Suillus clintonianus]KAG2145795.1 hypothetical protein DEU56DRAFT_182093 [Suillus clintonianus]